ELLRMHRAAATLSLLLALPGCRLFHGAPEPAAVDAAHAGAKRDAPTPASTLGSGDVFEVRVFQEPDLSGVFRVATDGSIDFPLCGRVTVAGMTASAAA